MDERSIEAVQPEDLAGYTQCHFFAGVGLWSLCARRAGWPDDRPIGTGSCPCGPFSIAGKQEGFADPRHLWPQWFRLIRECRPDVLFGEQSADADAWLDLVSSDVESLGYAFGAADIPAAGFGGAHRRQRFGFVADANNAEWWAERAPWHDGKWPQTGRIKSHCHAGNGDQAQRTGDATCVGLHGRAGHEAGQRAAEHRPRDAGEPGGRVAHPDGWKPWNGHLQRGGKYRQFAQNGEPVEWLRCRDGRWRPVEPGLAPLVDAYPSRLALLRGFGDAIDVEAFTNLIAAYMEVAP